MNVALSAKPTSPEPLLAPFQTEHCCYQRFALALLGRFMRANKQEYPCKLVDISVGGLAVRSPIAVDEGERIIVYLDCLGGLEGAVVRQVPDGFALRLTNSQHKREKLAAQITWLVNRDELDPADGRRHERVVPRNGASSLTLGDGTTLPCQVMDVSISGALIATDARPAIDSEVQLGKLRSLVVRHHESGVALRFLDIQQPIALRRYFG